MQKGNATVTVFYYFNLFASILAMALTFGFYTLNLKIQEVSKLKNCVENKKLSPSCATSKRFIQ